MEETRDAQLDEAIDTWRRAAASAGLADDALDELEDHVRVGAQRLMEQELAAAEAVWVAARRAGAPRVLAEEFALEDPARARLERLGWMLFGALALFLGESATQLVQFGIFAALPSHAALVNTACLVGAIVLVAWVLRATARHPSALALAVHHRRWLAAVAIAVGVGVAGLVASSVVGLDHESTPLHWHTYLAAAISALVALALPLVLVGLLLRLGRRAGNSAAAGPVG